MEQTTRRIPIIAFLLSIPLQGLGHMYNGQLWKGILFFCGSWLLLLVLGLSGLFLSLSGFFFALAAALIYRIFVATHAAIEAARLKTVHLKWYNKWYVYICALLIIGILESVLFPTYRQIIGMRSYRVPSTAMTPTLKIGDHFTTKLGIYKQRLPERGDIVTFPFPEDRSITFLMRVIGLPGERIQIKDKVVFINDRSLDDPWSVHTDEHVASRDAFPRDNFGPMDIPEGEVFVLGDDRDYSQDSRFWGNLKIKDIEGKALYIYWSDDYDRIGKKLE
jgi:signal peptidase I